MYRTDDEETLDVLYNDMKNKSKSYHGKRRMASVDRFKAPNIDFKNEVSDKYDEILEKVHQNREQYFKEIYKDSKTTLEQIRFYASQSSFLG